MTNKTIKDTPSSSHTRRGFFGNILAFLGIFGLGGIGYVFGKYLTPVESGVGSGQVTIDGSELRMWGSKVMLVRGKPTIVVRTFQGIKALSAVCTHLGCIVRFEEGPNLLFCPCHGGKFDLDGKVIASPPEKPLELVAVKEVDGKVIVG